MKVKIIRWAAVLLILGSLFVTVKLFPAGETKYELSENQRLRLELQQSKFQIAQEHYQQAANAFNAEVRAVEKENSWPDDLQFDPNALTFRELPKPPAPPEPPAKAPETNKP